VYTLVPEDLISHNTFAASCHNTVCCIWHLAQYIGCINTFAASIHLLHLATIQFAASCISHNTFVASIHLLHQYICCILPIVHLLHFAHHLAPYICCFLPIVQRIFGVLHCGALWCIVVHCGALWFNVVVWFSVVYCNAVFGYMSFLYASSFLSSVVETRFNH